MMKKSLLILVLVVCFTGSALAQKDKNEAAGWKQRISLEFTAMAGWKQHGMTPLNIDGRLGYKLKKRLSVMVVDELEYTLVKSGGAKTYLDDFSLGGGLGYVFFVDENDEDCVDVRLQVLNTIGNVDRKHTTYDLGFNWFLIRGDRFLAPVVGLGYRYEASHTHGIRSWAGPYITFGVRF